MAVCGVEDYAALERSVAPEILAPRRGGSRRSGELFCAMAQVQAMAVSISLQNPGYFAVPGLISPVSLQLPDYTNCTKPFFRTFLYTLLTICQARFFQLFPKKPNVKVHKCYKSVTAALKKHKCTFLEVYWRFFADFREILEKMNVHAHLGGNQGKTSSDRGADVKNSTPL